MVGTPTVVEAYELIQLGTRRLVFTAQEPGVDWDLAVSILDRAGIDITANWKSD